MFDEKKLWKDRASSRIKDLGRYLRYIFNGHLVVVLLFLIGTASFYYQKWIETLSDGFPAEIIIAVLIGILLTYSPVYNFLLEADQVFILPLEDKLKGYFLRSGGASLVFQGYLLLMVLAVLMPMYAQISSTGFRSFIPFLVILLALKAWNLATSWRIDYFVQSSIHRWDNFVRYLINATFTYLLFKQASIFILLLIVVVYIFYYFYFYVQTKKMGLKWDLLINQEEKRMASFYRLANMFTDVPKLRDTVKRRKWLDLFINRIAFSRDKTYQYLFSRAFLRSSDYLGLFTRLTVIGALAIYFIAFGIGQILLGILFLYLTGFQLLPLWNHHQNKLWVDLYPVEQKYKTGAFYSLLMTILAIQAVIFSLFILFKGDLFISLLSLGAGLVFSYVFVYFYASKRLKS
ncbi:ABC transporter permease [Bacillus sp. ISL-40]|uniref:ABC transporter permease n=1 Tax=unclassified Bacillus (in: firmicutes) TaxID=185979 RepID=UPI001BE6B527|nr:MULTISPECIES: ABC transporter permease [unclassified Bacillus (in: firmicutes)]MBT2697050.1 ABC transporter permease [Bacillus sp. ISL-40]MBT2740409.1 ABC transporter permease [Bacillus sp. ISL-77]